MHLLPLLSAIAALCSTQLVVGLPQSQSSQERGQQTETYSAGDKFRDFLAGSAVLGGGIGLWKMHSSNKQNVKDLKEGQKTLEEGQKMLKKGQRQIKTELEIQNTRREKIREQTRRELAGIRRDRAPAGQENPPPGDRASQMSDWARVKQALTSNLELKRCIYAYLDTHRLMRGVGDDAVGHMQVAQDDWNDAARSCQNIPGFTKDIFWTDSNFDIVLDDVSYHPTRRDYPGFQGRQEFSVVDSLSQATKLAASYFTGSSRKPAVGPVPGGIFQGAGLGPVRIGR